MARNATLDMMDGAGGSAGITYLETIKMTKLVNE